MDGEAFRPPAPGEQIRFMTAGSVDDGKSTLIGRMLLDSGALMRDQLDALDDADLAALTDGLEAEREQGITIDVAYRYFATPKASFIIADAPGHEQYTRNMVTAASVSDVAVVVIDASRVLDGVLKPQTRRHTAIAALMGLDVIVAVNKMDAVEWSKKRFDEVEAAFADLAATLGLRDIICVPISARRGDNVVRKGGAGWWTGPALIDLIERGGRNRNYNDAPLRLPVQTLLRDGITRLYAGRVEVGAVRPGDTVVAGPQRQPATVVSVRIGGLPVDAAEAGASVAVELSEERDIRRGDVISAPEVRYVRNVVADLCWLDEDAWTKGRRYVLRQGALETQALIDNINFIHDVIDFARREQASALKLNDIANVGISTRDPILGDLYADAPGVGSFVLFNPLTNQTCAAGMIREAVS